MRNLDTLKLIFTLVIVGNLSMNITKAQTWTTQTSNSTEDLRAVNFYDLNTGIASGINGAIVTTTDGGSTWVPRTSGVSTVLLSVFMADALTAYAVGMNGTIVKTSDGGTTWTTQTSGTTKSLYNVFFVSPLTGWAVGETGLIKATTDGGTTWTTQTSGVTTTLNALCFTSATEGWITGNGTGTSNTVLHTADAGVTWQPQTAPAGSYYDISFINSNEGWIIGPYGAFANTTDGGTTWTDIAFNYSFQAWGVQFVSSTKGWMQVGSATNQNNSIKTTNDGGISWQGSPSPVNVVADDIFFINANTGWAVGNDGIILKYSSGTGIDNFDDNSAISVYPNPTKDFLNIENIESNTYVELCSILGNTIIAQKNNNSEKMQLDIRNLSKGLYFLKIENNRNKSIRTIVLQ